jgi:hypothetical protein
MANWFDKITKATDKMVTAVEQATSKTIKTYQEQGFDGLIDKTNDILNKTSDGIEKATIHAADKTQDYFKNISEVNKNIMDEVETNVGKGTLSAKIAKGFAVTANTTQIIADDLTEITKRLYKNIIEESQNIDNPTSTNSTQNTNNPATTQELDAISLNFTLSKIIGATQDEEFKWHDATNTTYLTLENSWYEPTSRIGGKNSISLLTFYLSKLSDMDYHNSQYHTELQNKAINILESYLVQAKNLNTTPVAVTVDEPVVTKTKTKTTPKIVTVDEPVVTKTKTKTTPKIVTVDEPVVTKTKTKTTPKIVTVDEPVVTKTKTKKIK